MPRHCRSRLKNSPTQHRLAAQEEQASQQTQATQTLCANRDNIPLSSTSNQSRPWLQTPCPVSHRRLRQHPRLSTSSRVENLLRGSYRSRHQHPLHRKAATPAQATPTPSPHPTHLFSSPHQSPHCSRLHKPATVTNPLARFLPHHEHIPARAHQCTQTSKTTQGPSIRLPRKVSPGCEPLARFLPTHERTPTRPTPLTSLPHLNASQRPRTRLPRNVRQGWKLFARFFEVRRPKKKRLSWSRGAGARWKSVSRRRLRVLARHLLRSVRSRMPP